MTSPIKGLCSTSITSPSIQSAWAVSCGLTFILSPIFGSICFIISFHVAKIVFFIDTAKFSGKKHRRAGECQGAKKNEEKDTKNGSREMTSVSWFYLLEQIKESRDLSTSSLSV